MKFKDVKVGMRVVHAVGEDKGIVTDIGRYISVAWDHGSTGFVRAEDIKPVEVQTEPVVEIGFKINPAQKIKKFVEIEEETPETFTFTISRRAAHELRAILGIMSSPKGCELHSELKEFFVYMSNQEDMLHLLETRSTLQTDFKQENIYK
jgi:hypothetical protein